MRNVILLICLLIPAFSFALNLDSLYIAINQLPDSQKVSTLITISKEHNFKNATTAKQLLQQANDIAIKTDDIHLESWCLLSLAEECFQNSQNDSANYYLNLVNPKFIHPAFLGNIYHLKGKIEYVAGDYILALENFMYAQTLFDSLGNEEQRIRMNIDIGNVYAQQGQFEEARNYYQLALDMAMLKKMREIEASALNNLAIMYKKEGKLDEALSNLKKALEIKEELSMQKSIALTLTNIGDLHAELDEFDDALYYHEKALSLKKEIDEKGGIAHSYNRIGLLYHKMKKYYHALEVLMKAQEILMELDFPKGLQENYKTLAQVYFDLKMYKNAFEYQRKYSNLTEQLFNDFTTERISEMQAKYENEKKNKEISLLQKENELIAAKVKRQRILRILLLISLLSAVLIIFLFYNRYRLKQKANKLLSKQNKEIKQKNEEIESQSEYLSNLNKELEKLSIVASKTDNAIMILDSKTNIEWVNDGFTRMYGYNLEEAKETKNEGLIGSLASLDIKDIVNIWYGEKKAISIETINTTKSGEKVWSQSTITPITDKNKNVQYLVVIESDITALKKAGNEIARKSNELMASIKYAKKIQQSFMPKYDHFKNYFKDYFLFLRPKDIVSGDFYWFTNAQNKLILACADCTGHGVPGAFMSIIGINFLEQIVTTNKELHPDIILDQLRKNVSNSLNKSNTETITRDGMDISIIALDKNKKQLSFAGAMSTMYIYRKNKIMEFSGDKMPIGYDELENQAYTLQNIELQENDIIYLFTDGFPDQFGGKKNKKFKYNNFKRLFKQIAHHPMEYQKELISNTFVEWKGVNEQVDDILIIGLKI